MQWSDRISPYDSSWRYYNYRILQMDTEKKEPMKPCLRLISAAAIEKDPQKRSAISLELSKLITQPGGLIELFSAVIDFDASSQKVTTHNQRFMAIADIISRLPSLNLPFEDYSSSIVKQLKPLLTSDNASYSNLAVIVMKSMLYSPRARSCDMNKIVIDPIKRGLSESDSLYKPHESVVAIHNCLQGHMASKLFIDVFPNLFYALNVLIKSPSSLKNSLKTILANILNSLSPGAACCLLEKTLFHSDPILRLYSIQAGDEGISFTLNSSASNLDNSTDGNSIIDSVMTLLEQAKSDQLVLEFFFHFQETMWSSNEESRQHLSAALIEPLLEEVFKEEPKLDVLTAVLTNRERSIDLVLRTLMNYITFLREASHDFSGRHKFVEKSITSCLNIIDALLAVRHDSLSVNRCLVVLHDIDKLHKLKFTGDRPDSEFMAQLTALIDRLRENTLKPKHSTVLEDEDDYLSKEYRLMLKDLNDELVPVRVHALVRLKQSVVENNQHTLNSVTDLCDKILSTLADQEPYVFLASINLIAEMAVRRTKEVLPKLVELYSEKELDIQHRINVGEVLVRLIRQMNDTAPHYSRQVMDALFLGCQDQEELVRVSSLTNIGEICKHLGESLDKYIVEIMLCIKSILSSDTIEVKRAALDLMRNTLMGIESSTDISPIQRDLKDIYNLLKEVKTRTIDPGLCLQADLALDEIRRLARQMLALENDGSVSLTESGGSIVGPELVKNIKVLTLKK